MSATVNRDLDRLDRLDRRANVLLAVAMPLGPLLVAVLRGVMPTFSADDAQATAAAVAAHPARQSATVWLGTAAIALLVPGVLAAARLTRAAAPRLTWWALGLLVPAYVYLGLVVGGDAAAWSAHDAGLGTGAAAGLLDHTHLAIDIGLGLFVVGHVLGTVLLGIALLKSGRVHPVFGWLLAVSQPLHFVAFVLLGFQPLDVTAWILTAAAMAAAGWALLHEPSTAPTVTPVRTELAEAMA